MAGTCTRLRETAFLHVFCVLLKSVVFFIFLCVIVIIIVVAVVIFLGGSSRALIASGCFLASIAWLGSPVLKVDLI